MFLSKLIDLSFNKNVLSLGTEKLKRLSVIVEVRSGSKTILDVKTANTFEQLQQFDFLLPYYDENYDFSLFQKFL